MARILFLFFVLLSTWHSSTAQIVPPTTTSPIATDSGTKILETINADRQGYKKIDSATELQFLVGHVQLKQDNTLFFCDSAVYNKKLRVIEAFGNIHINDNDSVHTYSQYLLYHVDTKIANLRKKVRLTDGKSNLFSEELQYDINQKIGEYHNGGRVENSSSKLTSKEAVYYADMKDVYFKKDVVLIDPKYNLKTDSLLYNTTTEIATFIAQTYIEDSARRKIKTREGFYDLKNKIAFFTSRTTIEDGAVKVTANKIETVDSTGYSKLSGNVVYADTAQGMFILANQIITNKKEGTVLATQHPLMIIKQEEDSTFITADTLFSGKLSKLYASKDSLHLKDTIKGTTVVDTRDNGNDSADRFFQAYSHVRIFSDSMQAICDSLFYSGKDSIFQLFKQPILWSNNNQITGDTIYLYTKNKKADRLYVFENGLLISKARENMYNQIRGNRLNGYFADGSIDYMRAKGNAESVYYLEDDVKLLIGVNKASGDIIDIRFVAKELNRVVFINEVKGVLYPVAQFPEGEKLLRNFQWKDDKRPKTKYELFEN
ncbi:MAG: OstA-like protein [Chitinophagaceae bacterium]